MVDRKANMRHGALEGCATHNRKRQWKTNVAKPTNKCPVCWAVWLADRSEMSVYECDIKDMIAFSNAFTRVIKPSSIEFIETEDNE